MMGQARTLNEQLGPNLDQNKIKNLGFSVLLYRSRTSPGLNLSPSEKSGPAVAGPSLYCIVVGHHDGLLALTTYLTTRLCKYITDWQDVVSIIH